MKVTINVQTGKGKKSTTKEINKSVDILEEIMERTDKMFRNYKWKESPDIIALQEVRDDVEFNKKGNNQAKELNKDLKYPYYFFYSVTDKRKERPEKYKHYCIEGTVILSKFPILKIEKEK